MVVDCVNRQEKLTNYTKVSSVRETARTHRPLTTTSVDNCQSYVRQVDSACRIEGCLGVWHMQSSARSCIPGGAVGS